MAVVVAKTGTTTGKMAWGLETVSVVDVGEEASARRCLAGFGQHFLFLCKMGMETVEGDLDNSHDQDNADDVKDELEDSDLRCQGE